jgi:predicted permease
MCDIIGLLGALLLVALFLSIMAASVLFELLARRWRTEDRNRSATVATFKPRARRKRKEQE